MKKPSMREKMQYHIDSLMEKGTVTMIGMLLIFTIIASVFVGLLAACISGGAPGEKIWDSFMHTLDAGNLAGDSLDNKINVLFMTAMTVFGLLFTSVLIGIINSSFENKIDEMKKGTSKVLEKGHVVILGYNYTLFALLESLIEANESEKKPCIVVVGDEDKEIMLDGIRDHIHDTKNTKIICRSGKAYEEYMLDRASIENAKSVIINARDDFHAIKILLAFKSYINDRDLYNNDLFASVVVHDKKFVNAAERAGGDQVKVIYGEDKISRIIAHSCNQRGLCSVFEELFDYSDNELYFEDISEAIGKSFRDILHFFEAQIPLGIYRENKVMINPPMDEIIIKGDKIILFEEDNGKYEISRNEPSIDEKSIISNSIINKSMMDLIILGQNNRLDDILKEYDMIADSNSIVKIIDTADSLRFELSKYSNIKPEYVRIDSFNSENLKKIPGRKEFNVLVLTNDDINYEDADSDTMIKLIELKRMSDETNNRFATTCEIRKGANQKLAEIIGGDNFVVSSNITSLLATQISENKALYDVFDELLSTEGSELYMRPIESFVKIGFEVNFDTVIEAAARNGCIALGYRKAETKYRKDIVTCPKRSDRIVFNKGDSLIVLAED